MNRPRRQESFLHGISPLVDGLIFGTARAVPFQYSICATGSSFVAKN